MRVIEWKLYYVEITNLLNKRVPTYFYTHIITNTMHCIQRHLIYIHTWAGFIHESWVGKLREILLLKLVRAECVQHDVPFLIVPHRQAAYSSPTLQIKKLDNILKSKDTYWVLCSLYAYPPCVNPLIRMYIRSTICYWIYSSTL